MAIYGFSESSLQIHLDKRGSVLVRNGIHALLSLVGLQRGNAPRSVSLVWKDKHTCIIHLSVSRPIVPNLLSYRPNHRGLEATLSI